MTVTKRKPRKTPQQTRTQLRDKCDVAFSKFIRARDKGCVANVIIGEGPIESSWSMHAITHAGGLQCAHILSRRYLATRFDPENAVTLCQGHHVFYTHRPEEWVEWSREFLGPEKYEALRNKALNREPIGIVKSAPDSPYTFRTEPTGYVPLPPVRLDYHKERARIIADTEALESDA